jgi:hypothetical protein
MSGNAALALEEETGFDFEALRGKAFGQLADGVAEGNVDRETVIEIMRRAALAAYPDCVYAIGHGSALSGRFAPYSDLDVVVLLRDGQYWEKRCLNFEGYLVEFQAYTLDILEPLIQLSKHSGMSFGLMAADGEIVVDTDGGAATLQQRLREAFDEGPKAASAKTVDGYRHKLTNRIIELMGASEPAERVACGLSLFELLTRIHMHLDIGWRHSGKWIPRMLERERPGAFAAVTRAYERLLEGEAEPLASLASKLLDRLGGPLWEGHVMKQPLTLDLLPAAMVVTAAQQIRG